MQGYGSREKNDEINDTEETMQINIIIYQEELDKSNMEINIDQKTKRKY